MATREQDVRTWSMLCHLAALLGFLFPLGTIIGPLLVWQIKKNELPEIDSHGKEAVNFQITILIINILTILVIGAILGIGFGFSQLWRSPFTLVGGGFGLGIILVIINLLSWILAIVAGLKANNGEFYRYPISFRIIK